MNRVLGVLIVAAAWLNAGCTDLSVNRSIRVKDGETRSGSLTTVNGSIDIGDECRVRGTCRTVNGAIRVGYRSSVRELQTVNGGIKLDEGVAVRRDIESVNGGISCDPECEIGGGISTVNGGIRLERCEIDGDISTHNGSIDCLDRTVVKGDITIKRSRGSSSRRKPLRITVDDSVIHGDVINFNRRLEVILILRDNGRVRGDVKNVKVVEE